MCCTGRSSIRLPRARALTGCICGRTICPIPGYLCCRFFRSSLPVSFDACSADYKLQTPAAHETKIARLQYTLSPLTPSTHFPTGELPVLQKEEVKSLTRLRSQPDRRAARPFALAAPVE